MVFLKNFYGQNLIQIYTKTPQIAPFKKKLLGEGHASRHANFLI